MNNVCRTCGFSDCPGANGGQCPRWPARETAFDTLTLDELYNLHAELCADICAIGDRLLDGETPRIPVFSDEWRMLSAKQGEVWEMAESALAEIIRRELEAVKDA